MAQLKSFLDAQTSGSPQQIWQDPNNPNNIHAVYTYSNWVTGSLWQNSTVYYFFSSDKGLSWTKSILDTGRLQQGIITGLSDGRVLAACNAGPPEPNINYTRIFAQNSIGSNSFIRLLPGGNNYLNPRIIATGNVNLSNKFVFVNSVYVYDAFINVGTSLTSSNFLGYNLFGGNESHYTGIGRGADGRIGLAYTVGNFNQPVGRGDVYFMESTDNGTTFSTPVCIYRINTNNEGYGGWKGLSVVYQDNSPKVFFETALYAGSQPNPNDKAALRFWSPSLSGSDPNRCKVVADSSNTLYSTGVSDGYSMMLKISSPSAGISGDGNMITCAFMVRDTAEMPAIAPNTPNKYHHICIINSTDGGDTWSMPERITPVSPKYDWTYVSISPTNDYDANNYYVNMTMQRDTIPGCWTLIRDDNGVYTDANPFFVRAAYTRTAPLPPTNLTSPVNSQNGVATNVNLQWQPTTGALSYNLQISTDRYFNNIVYSKTNLSGNAHSVEPGNLALNTNYYWRVRPMLNSGLGLYSDGWGFHTRTTGIQETSGNIPTEYKLYNNYPNPFNPSTKIKFDLPQNSYVKINVFDITGRIISELANTNLQAGSYETEFNGVNASSGIYYYRIEAGNFVETKKMILIK
ncbi:MAG: T9SS type A sorting domain-containing protein [Ignavibacteria bacterium]|nr:T9SS type A sorting domain-containing protein [Ignavibacteria bacterium]